MPASRPRVAIERVHDDQLDLALEQLLAWLGPPASLIPAGSRVLIKPNLTISPTILGITRTELVEALVRWIVRQTDAADVAIGEGSGDVYTSQAFRLEGYRRIAARYGVRLVDLNVEPAVRVEVPPELGRDHVMVPRAAAEADVLISLPIWKLWGNAPLSLSLKNHFGLYGGRYYGHNKHSRELAPQHPHYGLPGDIGDERGIHAPTTNQAIVAVNLAAPIHLAIIDALEASDGRGHYLRWDTLVAGTNAVATDAVGMAMAGYVPQEQEVLQLCNAHGLGPARLDAIELLGLPLDEVSFDLKRLREGVREMPLAYCLRLLGRSTPRRCVPGSWPWQTA